MSFSDEVNSEELSGESDNEVEESLEKKKEEEHGRKGGSVWKAATSGQLDRKQRKGRGERQPILIARELASNDSNFEEKKEVEPAESSEAHRMYEHETERKRLLEIEASEERKKRRPGKREKPQSGIDLLFELDSCSNERVCTIPVATVKGGVRHGSKYTFNARDGTYKQWGHLQTWHPDLFSSFQEACKKGRLEEAIQQHKATQNAHCRGTLEKCFQRISDGHAATESTPYPLQQKNMKLAGQVAQVLQLLIHASPFSALDDPVQKIAFTLLGHDGDVAVSSYRAKNVILPAMLNVTRQKLCDITEQVCMFFQI